MKGDNYVFQLVENSSCMKDSEYNEIERVMQWARPWQRRHKVWVPLWRIEFWRKMYRRHHKITTPRRYGTSLEKI